MEWSAASRVLPSKDVAISVEPPPALLEAGGISPNGGCGGRAIGVELSTDVVMASVVFRRRFDVHDHHPLIRDPLVLVASPIPRGTRHESQLAVVEQTEVIAMRDELERETDVVVVGGGVAGLMTAMTAAQAGSRVTVLEANELGGRGRTADRDGYALNIGPHALYLTGALRTALVAHGIDPAGGTPPSRSVGLVRNGERHHATVSALGLATNPVLKPRSRARALSLFARLPRMKPAAYVGHSVSDWLGDEPVDVQQFLSAFIRVSTYTHAPDQFDAGAAVAQLQMAFQGVRYIDGGWTRIIDAMTRRATGLGATVHDHAIVTSIASDGRRVVVAVDDREISASAVVVATGGPDVATRLTGAEVAGRDAITRPIRAASLDIATRHPFPDSFSLGMDRPLYLSPHAPVAKMAPLGRGLVCAMRYIGPDEDTGDPTATRDELRHLARSAGIRDEDVLWERALHQSIVTHGSPTAAGGGTAGRPRHDALGLPGVYIAGDWVGPTGLLADASAASGIEAGRSATRHCASIRV